MLLVDDDYTNVQSPATDYSDSQNPVSPYRAKEGITPAKASKSKLNNREETKTTKQTLIIKEPNLHSSIGLGPMKVEMIANQPLLPPFKTTAGALNPSKVDQGTLKNCCMPAALAAMANTASGTQRLRSLISIDYSKVVRSVNNAGKVFTTSGLVTVKFFNNVKVDISRLLYYELTSDGGNIYYASYDSGQEGWVSFIEKAYAVYVSKKKYPSYAQIAYIDAVTVMKDLMGKQPRVIDFSKKKTGLKECITRAVVVPTIATTPKFSDNRFNIKPDSSIIANHAYAVRQMKKLKINGAVRLCVILTSPDDFIEYDSFVQEFDMVVAAQ